MLAPDPVSRILVAGSRDRLEPVLRTLQRLRAVHLEDYKGGDAGFSLGRPLEGSAALSEKLLFLRSAAKSLGSEPGDLAGPVEPARLDARLRELEALEARIREAEGRRQAAEARLRDLEARREALALFAKLPLPLELYGGSKALAVFTGTLGKALPPERLALLGEHEVFGGPEALALFVPASAAAAAQRLLSEHGFAEVPPPPGSGIPAELVAGLDAEAASLKAEEERLRADLQRLRKENADLLLAGEEALSLEAEKAEAPLRLALSANAFALEGWVLTRRSREIERELRNGAGDSLHIAIEEARGEEVPVALRNPRPAKPFEGLLELLSRPLYREVDPTAILALLFSVFFGLMVGDVGYGAAILLLGLYMGRPGNLFQRVFGVGSPDLSRAMVAGAVASMLFGGVLFGEAFGIHFLPKSPVEAWDGPYALVHGNRELFWSSIFGNREAHLSYAVGDVVLPLSKLEAKDLGKLLLITALFGSAHISLGLLLGFRNEARVHGLKTAVLVKGGWLVGFQAIALLAASVWAFGLQRVLGVVNGAMAGHLPGFGFPAVLAWLFVAMVVVCVLMVFLGEGAHLKGMEKIGPLLEMPQILVNTISYTRLAAVGAAKAGLALVANDFFFANGLYAPGGPSPMLAGGVAFHLMVPFLGILSGSLQSLRLHYYEFFSKFYTGGGRPFEPFGKRRRYTKLRPAAEAKD
ncbi:MAG: V-type ATP synthase subunit I [Halobacteria archaeon]